MPCLSNKPIAPKATVCAPSLKQSQLNSQLREVPTFRIFDSISDQQQSPLKCHIGIVQKFTFCIMLVTYVLRLAITPTIPRVPLVLLRKVIPVMI